MPWTIALHVGESFAEIAARNSSGDKLFFNRWYLTQQSLTAGIQNFLKSYSEIDLSSNDSSIVVDLRFHKKILRLRTGSLFAQVVTSGYEDWVYVRQNPEKSFFEIHPKRAKPLTTQDYTYGVSERIDAAGAVLEPLKLSELETIAEKLRASKVQRVCIQFLHAQKNPTHQKQAAQFFIENGFSVFISEPTAQHKDEVALWRQAQLNAFFAGTVEDVLVELQKCFALATGEEKPLHVLGSDGKLHVIASTKDTLTTPGLSWALASSTALSSCSENPAQDLFYLGLEFFAHIKNRPEMHWISPWGPVECNWNSHKMLSLQPTQSLMRIGSDVVISENEVGYEPGPMLLGRGLTPCLFDLIYSQTQKETDGLKLVQAAQQKFSDLMASMLRGSSVNSNALYQQIVRQVALEISLESKHKEILLTGPIAEILYPELKRILKDNSLILHRQSSYALSFGLLQHRMGAQK